MARSKDLVAGEAEASYQEAGLVTRRIVDEPGEVYEAHRHGTVHLLTLKGSAMIKLDDKEWQSTVVGEEVKVGNNQLHEVMVGDEGWEYIFATTQKEIERQGL